MFKTAAEHKWHPMKMSSVQFGMPHQYHRSCHSGLYSVSSYKLSASSSLTVINCWTSTSERVTEIAGVDNSARSKSLGWKMRELTMWHEMTGVEKPGVDNAAPDDRGGHHGSGKRGSGKRGTKYKGGNTNSFTFSKTLVYSALVLRDITA